MKKNKQKQSKKSYNELLVKNINDIKPVEIKVDINNYLVKGKYEK